MLFASFAVAACANSVPREWKTIYSKVSQTIVHNDVKSYMSWMDKSFVNIQDGKQSTFSAYEKEFSDFLKPFTNIKAEAKPTTYHVKGKDVVIDFRYTFSGDYTAKGQKKTLHFFEEGTDTWRKVNGHYLQFVETIKKQGLIPEPKKATA